MIKLFSLGLAALLCSACLSTSSWATGTSTPICQGVQRVEIEQGQPPADPTNRIVIIPDVQVPNNAPLNAPITHREWNYLANSHDILIAYCFNNTLDKTAASSAQLQPNTSKCTLDTGTFTCQ